uniref:Uncharacterized protein n=1 Tax=Parascaris equorum TaxID=6256 RepID=A0A914R4L3_PAREQ
MLLQNDGRITGHSQFDGIVTGYKKRGRYGWEQCEFSPMSCLLRRRRRQSASIR